MENKNCKLCGAELVDGNCPNGHSSAFKKMCLNCKYFNDEFYCTNVDVMEKMKSNILKDIEDKKVSLGNFVIKDIELAPIPVKAPIKRCSKWELNDNIANLLINNYE